MARKKTQPGTKPQTFPRKCVPVAPGNTEQETAQNTARVLTSPELAAYRVINGAEQRSGLGEHIDVPAVMAQLREQAAAANGGNLATAEAMLMNQATALQSLFARLAERGMGCDNATPFECNMRMALRAQAQCRATLETLAAIKNPPVLIARQANVTTGPQQINNGVPTPRAREIETEQTQLLRAEHGERLDTGTTGAASRGDPALATVGTLDGAEVARR